MLAWCTLCIHQFCWRMCNQANSPKRWSRKVLERQAPCRRSGWSFLPFAMETIGVWGVKANQLLQKLVTAWANNNGCSKREASLVCRSRLQLALVRGLARQLEWGFLLPQPQSAADEFERTCTPFKHPPPRFSSFHRQQCFFCSCLLCLLCKLGLWKFVCNARILSSPAHRRQLVQPTRRPG